MKRATPKSKSPKKVNWAAEVRKHKPELNALTDAERRELFEEGLAMIYGRVKTERHASRR